MTLFRGKEGLTAHGDDDLAKKQADILDEFRERHPGVPDISLTGGLTQTARATEQEPRPAPERIKVYPEISLEEEFARQAQLIVERFVKYLGKSERDVFSLLPKRFPERPKSFNDDNSVPGIIPKFSFTWGEAVDAAKLGMSDYLRDRLSELSERKDPRGIVTPNRPYGAWFYVGDDYLRRKPSDVRDEIRREGDRRGSDHWDGLGLSVVREDIVKAKPFDLVASGVGLGGMVDVRWWDGRPRFFAGRVDDAVPGFRGLVCGSEFST